MPNIEHKAKNPFEEEESSKESKDEIVSLSIHWWLALGNI